MDLIDTTKRLEAIAFAIASPGFCEPEQVRELLKEVPALLARWQLALDKLPAELDAEEKRRGPRP